LRAVLNRSFPHILVALCALSATIGRAQDFTNNDLEGAAAGVSVLPPGWTFVPWTDPVCEATADYAATPDCTDPLGPVYSNGIMGNPYSGLVFMCGLYGSGYDEGLMQTVSGFTVGCQYTIGLYQTVVKQSSTDYLDETGGWEIFLDNTLVGQTIPTYSAEPPISLNKPWEFRTMTFTATAALHTIKFMPWDDDGDTDPPNGVRMGIDSIFIQSTTIAVPGAFLGNDTTICPGGSVLLDTGLPVGTPHVWQDGSTGDTFLATVPGEYWVEVTAGCGTAIDSIEVVELGTAAIDLGPDTTVCEGSGFVLDATTPGATYSWQDESLGPTYSVTLSGLYSVEVSASGCVATGDIQVDVIPAPVIDLGPDLVACSGDAVWLDATYPGATYQWQDGWDQATYDASVGGTFSVTVTLGTCSDSDAIDVVIGPAPNAGTDGAITLCNTGAITIIVDQLGGTPDAGGVWSAPDGTPFSGNFLPGTDTPGIYTYTLAAIGLCPADQSIVTVDVMVEPDPGTDASLTLCSAGAPVVMFDNLNGTPDAGGSWTDPFGALFASDFDPSTSSPGDYTYGFPASAPCPAVSAIVNIGVVQVLDPGTDAAVEFCADAVIVDLFGELGGTPDAGGQWTGAGGAPFSGSFDPTVHPPGDYLYEVDPGTPCPSLGAVVTVNLSPEADAGPDAVLCDLDHDLGAVDLGIAGTWSGPVGISFADPSVPNTSAVVIAGAVVTLTWTTTSPGGCVSSDDVEITFSDAIVTALATTNATCNGDCNGTAIASATGGNPVYTYVWIGGNSPDAVDLCAGDYALTVSDANGCTGELAFTIEEPPVLVINGITATDETCPGTCDGTISLPSLEGATFSIDGGTTYQTSGYFADLCAGGLTVIMQDPSGCTALGVAEVMSPEAVIADFVMVPETLFVDGTTGQFTSLSSENTTALSWDFDGLGTSTDPSPVFTFPENEPMTYTICLAANDANGCADTLCKTVVVLDRLTVYVPNAFTPDGDDTNEGFAPVINVPWIANYEFMVFDRWGELIFSSEKPGEAWDGQYGGEAVQTGVYVWKLKYREQWSTDLIETMGHVTLLR